MSERRKILDLFEEQKDFWEARVASGIEQHRKGDGRIKLVDQNGKPLSGVKVKLTQKSHQFRFGANIFMLDELETEEKNEAYKKAFADVFNMATLPFYWDTLEPERGKPRYAKDSPKVYRRPAPDLCIEFCEKHGIEPREHGLAYEWFFPKWLHGASIEETKRELERRYAEISERYADKIRTIEVTNELDRACKVKFLEEPEFMMWCFKLAEKYFPNNQLVSNEHTPLTWQQAARSTDQYYSYVAAHMLNGARIDAVGLQYHLYNRREDEYTKTRRTLNPQHLYRNMDLFARLGKPLQLTEVSVPAFSWEAEDEAIQAELIEKLYSIWFSHPNVEQIIYWNLVDGYAYGAEQGDMKAGENYYHGGLLRFDLSPKPAYLKIKELTQERWHTEVEVTTDAKGCADFRGFYGDYEVAVGNDTQTVSLLKNQENIHTLTV
ncbi:MAG: endo-1,4-beta-xylanase [Oscillospiraceae bacterium]|nr:endo-1,4-beta-xylanase [Oscillospiraceae bacterium]